MNIPTTQRQHGPPEPGEVALFDYLSLLFWQAVTADDFLATQEAVTWIVGLEDGDWGQCDVCLRYVRAETLTERDRHQQQYCPECRP